MPRERTLRRSKIAIDAQSRKPKVSAANAKRSQRPVVQDTDVSDDDITSQSDTDLEQEVELPVKDDTRRNPYKTPKPRKPKVREQTEVQESVDRQHETVTGIAEIKIAPHMVMYSTMYHLRIAPIIFPVASTYIPSFYQFFFALQAAHNLISENTYLRYLAPGYLTIASRLYYGYLGIIQILRAKNEVGNITKVESQCLRRFERTFPFESLPIMSPLIMFFQNLGAVKMTDPYYSWITPTLPDKIGTGVNEKGIFAVSENIMLPNVPALIRFLFELGNAPNMDAVTSDDQELIPTSFKSENTDFFGIPSNGTRATDADYQRLVFSGGWLGPTEIPSNLDISTFKRIKRWGLPNLTLATDLSTVVNFLQTDGDVEWFKNLIWITTEEAKFFDGSTNLSNIPTTSGLSSLIEISHTDQGKKPKMSDIYYPFSQESKYPLRLWRFDARTTRGITTAEDTKIGATTQHLVRKFGTLTPEGTVLPEPQFSGAYFSNNLADGRQVTQIETDKADSPKVRFQQVISEHLYKERGPKIKD